MSTTLLGLVCSIIGQDFERKSALFSLASSEVLIVNLWEHQVGLYQGANMGLLKTVFEVNLGLFGKKSQDGCVLSIMMSTFHAEARLGGIAPMDVHYFSSSFATILAQLPLRISKPLSQLTFIVFGNLLPSLRS